MFCWPFLCLIPPRLRLYSIHLISIGFFVSRCLVQSSPGHSYFFIAMGRPKGSTDKRQRKRRGGDRDNIVPITAVTPIFASSNNRRGNVTRQQRLFAAHFQDVPLVRLPVGDSVGLIVGHSDGLSVEASAGLSLSDFVEGDSGGLNVVI